MALGFLNKMVWKYARLNVFAVFGLDRKQTNSHFVLPFGAAISGSHSVSQSVSQPVA